jgi:hypothetical protein
MTVAAQAGRFTPEEVTIGFLLSVDLFSAAAIFRCLFSVALVLLAAAVALVPETRAGPRIPVDAAGAALLAPGATRRPRPPRRRAGTRRGPGPAGPGGAPSPALTAPRAAEAVLAPATGHRPAANAASAARPPCAIGSPCANSRMSNSSSNASRP